MQIFNDLLGLAAEQRHLNFLQISLRGIVIFIAALVMIRMGNKRFLAGKTAFDVILGLILASMLARAINGSSPLLPTIGGGFVLVALHRLLAAIAFHSHAFGILIKGSPDQIIEDGRTIETNMRKNHISVHDLEEELRLEGKLTDKAKVKAAWIERSGDISVVPRSDS